MTIVNIKLAKSYILDRTIYSAILVLPLLLINKIINKKIDLISK